MKKCKHCNGEGRWEIPTISTHEIMETCEYCNGTGLRNKKLARKVKQRKKFKSSLSPYEVLDLECSSDTLVH